MMIIIIIIIYFSSVGKERDSKSYEGKHITGISGKVIYSCRWQQCIQFGMCIKSLFSLPCTVQ